MSAMRPQNGLTTRQWVGFWSMMVQQTQNAFNDKAAQFLLIPLGAAVAFSVESIAGLMIALPFVLFAPLAGWMSDRFSKRDVMVGAAVFQVVALVGICLSVWWQSMHGALVGFFALAVQSAFFGPAKIGITKELVGSKHLGFASGMQQMLAMLAMMAGQIVVGWWFDKRYQAFGGQPEMAWHAALMPLVVVTAGSVPAVALAWTIPRVPAPGGEPLRAAIAVQHFKSVKALWSHIGLQRASFGVAFFWGFATFINLWSLKVAKTLTGGGQGFGTLSSQFMAAASLGMATGFGVASFLLKRRIELGWVPLAGIAMTASSLVLAMAPPGGGVFFAMLALLAFCAAMFLAPLNAWMQDHYPPDQRGEMQAAANLQDCFAGILAVIAIELLAVVAQWLGLGALAGYRWQMAGLAAGCGLVTWMIVRLLPADFLRLVGVGVVRCFYRIRVVHADRIPREGGALLLPNHITFADAFFLSAACPRPVRFVMDETFMARRSIRLFVSIFRTVTIRKEQPREAIRVTIEALKKGDVVCLFPEGQLTRTGALNELRRGCELIAKKSGHPLVPVWTDGAWGSVFSFERGRFFRKRPYRLPRRLTIAFGRVMASETITLERVRQGLDRAAAEAIQRRFHLPGLGYRVPQHGGMGMERFRALETSEKRRVWINGYQIGQLDALKWREPFAVWRGDEEMEALPSLTLAFAELFGSPAQEEAAVSPEREIAWVGGERLRQALASLPAAGGGQPETGAGAGRQIAFYDFSERAQVPLRHEGVAHYPCLAIAGVVVSMSLADPPLPIPTSERQRGSKPGTRGKLLPGFYLRQGEDGTLRVKGPAAPAEGLPLPAGWLLDEEGFVVCGEAPRAEAGS